ncbi:hypothetical protein [Streptomyces sp. cg35]|uniref:hypothetical protein n=1 Tax=Streptomyces sp. cg35 TaxID=3421650 RepID=UPI003D17A2D2
MSARHTRTAITTAAAGLIAFGAVACSSSNDDADKTKTSATAKPASEVTGDKDGFLSAVKDDGAFKRANLSDDEAVKLGMAWCRADKANNYEGPGDLMSANNGHPTNPDAKSLADAKLSMAAFVTLGIAADSNLCEH